MVNIMALMADMNLPTMGVKIMVIMPLIVRHKAIYSLVGWLQNIHEKALEILV